MIKFTHYPKIGSVAFHRVFAGDGSRAIFGNGDLRGESSAAHRVSNAALNPSALGKEAQRLTQARIAARLTLYPILTLYSNNAIIPDWQGIPGPHERRVHD